MTKAIFWLEKAAVKNNLRALRELASIYEYGWGVEENTAKAYYYYKRSADLGCAVSMRKVVMASFVGEGTPIDLPTVIKYGEKYADYISEHSGTSPEFEKRLEDELVLQFTILAYLAKGRNEAIMPLVGKIGVPYYSLLISMILLSPFAAILIGVALWRRFGKGRKRGTQVEWSVLDAMNALLLFFLFSTGAWASLFVPGIASVAGMLLPQAAAVAAVFGVYAWIARKRGWSVKEKFSLNNVPPLSFVMWVLGGLSAVFAFDFGYDYIASWLDFPRPEQLTRLFLKGNAGDGALAKVVIVLTAGLIIPIFEELLFRGVVHQGLKSKLPVWAAIIASSMIFSGCHVQLSTIPPLFVMGVVLAWSYEKTKSIYTPIAIHIINNLIAVAYALVL